MTEVIRAAGELQALCEGQRWRFCIIGGLALQHWGEPRETIDVEDILIRQTGKLDWHYIHAQLKPLAELKGAPELLDELEKRRVEFER